MATNLKVQRPIDALRACVFIYLITVYFKEQRRVWEKITL